MRININYIKYIRAGVEFDETLIWKEIIPKSRGIGKKTDEGNKCLINL